MVGQLVVMGLDMILHMQATMTAQLQVLDLGRVAYPIALAQQQRLHQAVCDGVEPATLLLLEHDPVVTMSARRGAGQHLLVSYARLRELGIDLQSTDRGGDVTYHGPGQLIVYPILRLDSLRLNLGRYMRLLEQIVIDTAAIFGVMAHREPGATGVWVDPGDPGSGTGDGQASRLLRRSEKICAMGVRVRRRTTMHGLALNVTTDLSHFQTIVPCGLVGRSVTSLAQLLGADTPSMSVVKHHLVAVFTEAMRNMQNCNT